MAVKQLAAQSADSKSDPVVKTGLCLLSLDGGGVRGLSSLHILKRVMDEVNRLRKLRGLSSRRPCEVFDMIGGTSTGGLIAIMLGRLGMDVDECIQEYEELMGTIFGSKAHSLPVHRTLNVAAQYDAKKVKKAIEDVLEKHNVRKDAAFNDGIESRCRVFVCCVAKDSMSAVRIRSYDQDFHGKIPATICQAALATSAATSYFEPVMIGSCQYVDGALRNNNPVMELEAEALALWCPDQVELKDLVKCFLSIGTGTPAKEAISDNAFKLMKNNLKYLATDTEATNQRVQERWRRTSDDKRFFRFDVAQGLQNVELADYKKVGLITTATDEYMEEGEQSFKLQACTENLMEKGLQGTPLDFHETVSSYKLRNVQGSYDIKDFRDCRAVLNVTDVEKDRNDLKIEMGDRVPGTLEWITTEKQYQNWQSTGPDSLWITALPARGKTMLSLFILDDLERKVTVPGTPSGSVLEEEHGKKADLFYFFCSSDTRSRQGSVAVLRSLIHQIVSKHENLMKYVLEYLSNNQPVHVESQPQDESERQPGNQERKDQRSRSNVGIQNPAEQNFPSQTNFVKNFMPVGFKGEQGSIVGARREAEKKPQDESKNKSRFLQNMLGNPRKEEQSSDRLERQQGVQSGSGTTSSAHPTEKDSPKARQLELLDTGELSFILRKLIRELSTDTIYVLLDGLDKCPKEDREALVSRMLRLRDIKPGKLKLLVVSRRIGGMGTTPTIKLEETEQTRGDLEKFVSKSVEQLVNVDGFKDIQQEVEETLLRGTEGTYLWVSLVMVEIKKMKTCTEILAASRSFPPGLDNNYRHMLKQIDLAHRENLYQILRWVTVAIRPFTLQELSAVIKVPPSSSIPPEQVVRDAVISAEGLLKIQGDEVTLIHSTVKEFFLSANGSNDANFEGVFVGLEELHHELAESCYKNLLGSGLSRTEMRVSQLSDTEEPKLLKYAIKHWMDHVKASDWAEKKYAPDSEFFRKDSTLRKNWWKAYLEDSQNDDPKNFNIASLVHLSAYFGILAWIKQGLEGKAWIKKVFILREFDHYHRTPLHIAVEQGHGPVVSLLLEQGSDIESREASLFATPLHIAARNGHENICKILLDHQARINARNRFHSTPLTEAARGGHLDIVKLLVGHGADINGSIDKTHKSLRRHIENLPGQTERALGRIDGLSYAERSPPVIEAARQNHAAIIRYLVRNGADIEATIEKGSSALQVAAFSGQMRAVEVLVELGADIERQDEARRSALYMASWQNHADVVKWLLDKNADGDSNISTGFTPLHIAAKNGHLEPMKLLLEAGAKIERRDEKGFTALACAAEWGRAAAIEFLIDRNAKIDAQTDAGNSALMLVIQENVTDELVEMVQLLLKHGANVNLRNRNGLTPLMKAAGLSNNKDAATIVQHLLEKEPDLGARDNEGRTALMHACKGGSNKTQELLLSKDVDLEAKDDLGDTALIIAAGYSDPGAVRLLLERGADIEARDNFGFTPLIKAAKCGLDESVKLLLDNRAQIAVVDNDDKAAMDHAARRMREKIVKSLESSGASRRTLKLKNRATASLSNVTYWDADDLQFWERRWEVSALKKSGSASKAVKASDVHSDDLSEMMSIDDDGASQTSVEVQIPQDEDLEEKAVHLSAKQEDDHQEARPSKDTDDETHSE